MSARLDAPRLSGVKHTFSSSLDSVCLSVNHTICQPLLCLPVRNDNFSCSHRCAPSSPLQRTHLIVGHPHSSACVEPRSAGGEEGLGWGHRLSLITNTVANGSAVEAVALQPCDLQLTLPTGLFCLHAAHGWLHPLSVIERVEVGGGGA